jgi:hydroxymethylbilane synthase
MASSPFRIGTRGSQLALWQANTVRNLLERNGYRAELAIIKTTGDRLSEAEGQPAKTADRAAQNGKRLFVKEIEEAMLRQEVDIAVHSAKDMPAELPAGLSVAAVLAREDARDALVLPAHVAPSRAGFRERLAALGTEPRLGTSSIRRVAQIRALVPGARFEAVRGNVDTRLRKVDQAGAGGPGRYDALILAAAGLRRLGLADRISSTIPIDLCTPAPGQGAIAVEIREDDRRTRSAVEALNDEETAAALEAERALVAALGGGCQLPLGALAWLTSDGQLELMAVVIAPDASRILRARLIGEMTVPSALGRRVADALLSDGAASILDEARAGEPSGAP